MPIAFLRFSIHRDSMGQQLRVRIKRKRRLAYLRRKYASRRLRLIRTWCCCPMESLWIENPRNAISIETDCVIFRSASCLAKGEKTKVSGLNLTSQSGVTES